MQMDKKKAGLISFLFILVVISMAFYQRWLDIQRYKTGIQSVATVWPAGKDIEWQYMAGGSYYLKREGNHSNPYIEYGERFKLYYDPDKPDKASIALWEPVFDTAACEKTFTEALNEKYEKGITLVSYYYPVNGKLFHRRQKYKFGRDFDGKALRYVVYYNKVQPKIAYVDLSAGVR